LFISGSFRNVVEPHPVGREPHGVVGCPAGRGRLAGGVAAAQAACATAWNPCSNGAGIGGDDDLVGQQAVQLQQQGVGVLLVIRVEGRAQFLDLLLDEAKLWDDGAFSVRFDGVQDGGDSDHQWLPFIAEKNGPACRGQIGGRGLARRAQTA
jgi:hypothetical protein